MNGGQLGFLFTAKDLASGAFARQNKNVKSLAANSDAAAALYERSMARIKRGAMQLGVAVIGLGAMVKVTKTFGEFQYVMASTGAVMHATASEMKMLERAAIDAGIATQFSPKEAAEGLQALGAAGLRARQAVQVLNPVLDLASASMGQLGVAGAAENVVGVLNAFSMQADRAGEVADKLVKIASLTGFQFRDFGVAISQAAAQAYTADQTFESMLATLGMLRNTNLHASAAATSYREAVRRLSGDKRAHKELTKLHVEVLDKETGKIRDLGAIMADLAPRLEKMNSKEKNLVATRIFGVRGMKTYAAFVAQYHKLVNDGTIVTGDYAGAHSRLVDALHDSEGAAKDYRDRALETAEGQRRLLRGSWETTQIMLGKLALPVVLPALKALTSVLNSVIKILDAIPKPLRSMIANFVGVGLAIKGVVGAFNMLRGVAGVAMLGRMAASATVVSGATATAAANTGRLARATGRIRSGFASVGRAIGGALPIVGTAVAGLSALFSYMRQKEKEEMNRQKEIRRNNKLTLDSYVAAHTMAEKLRAATARSAETELAAAKKNYGAALKLVDKYSAQQFEASERVKNARKQWLLLADAQKRGAATHAEVRRARENYIKMGGKLQALNRALIAAEGEAARTELRRAKTKDEKEVAATRLVASRFQKQQAMEKEFRTTEKMRLAGIQAASGAERRIREKKWSIEKKQGLATIQRYQQETSLIALKYKLGDRELLQDRKRQRSGIRAVARTRTRALAGMAPTEQFMRLHTGWDAALKRKALPRMTAADVPAFQRYLATRGSELGLSEAQVAGLQQQAQIGRRGAIGRGPEYAFGGAPTEPTVRRRGRGDEPVFGYGLMAPAMENLTDLGRAVADAMAAAKAQEKTPVFNLYIDGEKIAAAVSGATSRGERQQDGVTRTSEGGASGAG